MMFRVNAHLQKLCALMMLMILAGCASPVGEAGIDWFVRVANEPQMVNFQFCVYSAPETEDGSNPSRRGVGHMACGDNLEAMKKQTIADCENAKKIKCMPVYYFERGKHDLVQDFESENISRKQKEANQRQLQIQAQQRQKLQEQCKGYGFISGTPSMAKCVMEIDITKRQVEERQAKLNSERASRVKDCNMKKAFEIGMSNGRNTGEENFQRCMSGLPPAPKLEVNCINIGGGQVRCTSQ